MIAEERRKRTILKEMPENALSDLPCPSLENFLANLEVLK